MAKPLTDLAIRKLQAGTVRREVADGGQRGLYLILQPVTGAKSFAVRFRVNGRSRKLTLPAGTSLAAARKAAADALFEVSQGRDPAAAKIRQREEQRSAVADTLEAICGEFFRREGSKIRTAKSWQRDLARLVYPVLGTRVITDIRRKDIVRLLDDIEDNRGPAQADMVLAIVRRIMNWHSARDDDFRSPIVRGMSRRKPSQHARARVLTDDETRAVWRAAGGIAGPFGHYVRFLLLTAARRNEAAHMRWSEISGADWRLPASRNKTKVDLVRPLSAAARSVLAEVPRIAGSDYVFTITGHRIGGMSKRKHQVDVASGVTGWTLHDLRRTARSLMARAGVSSEHAERCLGHVINGVEGTYNRHGYLDEMRIAYEKLATLIGQIVDPQPNVVAMVR
jgi:integrase